jgi:hypothetical protein
MKKLLFLCLCFASQICLNAAKSNSSKSESRKPFEETDYRLNLQRLATMPFYNPHNSDQSANRSLNSPRNYAEGKDNRNS